MLEHSTVRRGILAMGLVVLCSSSLAVKAADGTGGGGVPPSAERKIIALGVELSVDAETGRLRPPTAAQLAALRAAFQGLMTPPKEEPKPTRHANGAESVSVGLWQFGAGFAFVDPEAGLQLGCVDGAENLTKLMESKASPGERKAEVE